MNTKYLNLCGMTTLLLVMLTGCQNKPEKTCDELWTITNQVEREEMIKKCPDQAAAAADARKGTFKKSEPRAW